jgi:hypothetical protein|tara:strand:- start:2905 stop:3525 length:621 start_codon:yes stop_codon:yes gene_type:complete
MKNIELKLINRNFYSFIFLICLILLIASVYAFGTSTPSTFGHSAGELDLSAGVEGNVLFNGNLDVIGEAIFDGWLKVGDTEINCDFNSEGSLKYNSVNKTAEYCNSTGWREFGPPPPPPVTFEYIWGDGDGTTASYGNSIYRCGDYWTPHHSGGGYSESPLTNACMYCRHPHWSWTCRKHYSDNTEEIVALSFCGGVHDYSATCNF